MYNTFQRQLSYFFVGFFFLLYYYSDIQDFNMRQLRHSFVKKKKENNSERLFTLSLLYKTSFLYECPLCVFICVKFCAFLLYNTYCNNLHSGETLYTVFLLNTCTYTSRVLSISCFVILFKTLPCQHNIATCAPAIQLRCLSFIHTYIPSIPSVDLLQYVLSLRSLFHLGGQ